MILLVNIYHFWISFVTKLFGFDPVVTFGIRRVMRGRWFSVPGMIEISIFSLPVGGSPLTPPRTTPRKMS